MGERLIPVDLIASSAMKVMTQEGAHRRPSDLFHPSRYVELATNYLLASEWEKAVGIFEGILELNPGDGEAWNNLGFCALGESAHKALPILQKAIALQRPVPVITIANKVLALHLLDRDSEAIALATNTLGAGDVPAEAGAAVWLHPVEEGVLELGGTDDPVDYLRHLLAHIEVGLCSSTESSDR